MKRKGIAIPMTFEITGASINWEILRERDLTEAQRGPPTIRDEAFCVMALEKKREIELCGALKSARTHIKGEI